MRVGSSLQAPFSSLVTIDPLSSPLRSVGGERDPPLLIGG